LEIPDIFFSGWEVIGRTVVVGILAYATLVVLVRVSGKRTLASMNAFDFIVNVAIGSALATVLLSPDVALAEGVTSFIVLLGLQLIVSWGSSRSALATKIIKSEPKLLLYQGRLLRDAMREERIGESEMLQALRSSGVGTIGEAEAVILETNGNISVIQQAGIGDGSSLANVKRP
jgi:uncharacterized membrane protein YcaP (DUF421 family)